MEEYSVVQGQTMLESLFALLSVLVASYVFCSWRTRAHTTGGPEPKSDAELRNMLPRVPEKSNPNKPPSPTRSDALPAAGRLWWATHRYSLGNWLAPILVWSVVVGTGLAVTIILLGEN